MTRYKGGGWYHILLDDEDDSVMYRRGSFEVLQHTHGDAPPPVPPEVHGYI